MSMDVQRSKQYEPATAFQKMLNDFINLDTNKTNMGTHKNLQRSIQVFTKTQQCWGESIKVLLVQKDQNVLTLCSSILKNKLQFDFSQLDGKTFQELYSSILNIIAHKQNPSNSFRNNLSVCIAFIYIHKFQQIGDLMPFLSKCFPNPQNINFIYKVLEVLPEQIDNSELVVQEDKRIIIRNYLQTIQRPVLIHLNDIGHQSQTNKLIKLRILLKCFSNWIDLAFDKQIFQQLPNHYILQKAFNEIQNNDLSNQCILVLKRTIRSIQTPSKNPNLYKFLAERIISFFPLIRNKIKQQNYECEDYIYILSTFARASREQFISNLSNDYLMFINNMLQITSEPQFTSVALITFWEKFLISLVKNNDAIEFYREPMKMLLTILSKITSFTLYQCEQLNQRSTASFEKMNADFAKKLEWRRQVEDCFKLLAECLGPNQCLEEALKNIDQLQATNRYFWPLLECYLNPIENMIDEYSKLSQTLNQLVHKLIEISSPYVMVQKTFIRILSNCSILYNNNPEISLMIFNYLVNNLNNRDMEYAVSRAFENVCTNNVEFVLANLDSFIEIIKKYLSNDRILKGVMVALSNDTDKLNHYFPLIFKQLMGQLQTKTEIKEIKLVLDQIIIMLKEITKDNPLPYGHVVSQCFAQLWIPIKTVLQKQCKSNDDQSLLQKCTKLLKYALRCLKDHFNPFLDDLYSTILEAYSKYPIGSYIYLVEILVTIFKQAPGLFEPISILFGKMCDITFQHLSKLNHIQSNAELSEDFFGMLSRFMRFIPEIINNFCHFDSFLELANMGCGIQHGALARVFYGFVEDMYMQFWDLDLIKMYMTKENPLDKVITERSKEMYQSREKVRDSIFNNTYSLLLKMIKHLQEAPSTSVRHCIIDALLSEVKAFPNQNQQLWFRVLQTIPNKILTNLQKNKFIQMLPNLSESNLDDIQDMIKLIAKRYIHESIRSPIH